MFCVDRPYSSRRASVGLTFEARHAGMKAAARAPAARTVAAAAIVAGSVAVTPNNCDSTSLPRAATQGNARATPAADGGNGLLGSAANLDIESCAAIVVFEQREEDLLGAITDTAIADVGDDADDGAIGRDVRGATAPGDENAEGVAAGQIALDEG